jgi:hypothetical protein
MTDIQQMWLDPQPPAALPQMFGDPGWNAFLLPAPPFLPQGFLWLWKSTWPTYASGQSQELFPGAALRQWEVL